MSRIDVPFVVEKQRIIQPTREKIASGGRNYFYATFSINDTWEDIENLKVVFKRDEIEKLIPLDETETGYECVIPWEVMDTAGSFLVGIFGGDRLLTDYAYVIVKQGCVTEGESPLPPTPDWFTKIEEDIANIPTPSIKIDSTLSLESENAVQNKVVTQDLENLWREQGGIISNVGLLNLDVQGIQKQINEHSHFKGYFPTDAKIQATEATPNDFAYSAESGTKWVYDKVDGWQDSGTPVPDQLAPASELTPLVNGEASVGTENAYARGDHRHPTDTSRASAAELNSLKLEINTALEHIIEIQNSLIGGDA